MLQEVGQSDMLPIDLVSTVAMVAAISDVARRHSKNNLKKGKEDGLTNTEGQSYIFTNQAFQTQTMAAHTQCETHIVVLWAQPQVGDTVMTMTPDQPFTTLSDCIHAFSAHSTVCTYVFRLSLFSLYCHRSVSTLSIPSLCTIT